MLDSVRSIARMSAGVIALGYLAYKDITLAVAVLFLFDALYHISRHLETRQKG
jgi:hypothetical protein